MAEVTIADIVRNSTMSADIAALLWAAVDERISFLTVALPRLAGKTTVANAVLALRPEDMPVQVVAGQVDVMERLKQERRGGYLQVAEFSQGPMPGYIWGEPVRRVFDTVINGDYALQAALHAHDVEEAFAEIVYGSQVTDEQASAIKLVVYIERFGDSMETLWRRVTQVYEVHEVKDGAPVGHPLFRWHAEGDSFEKLMEPHQFGRDAADLARRAAIIQGLADDERTTSAGVAAAVREYRASN